MLPRRSSEFLVGKEAPVENFEMHAALLAKAKGKGKKIWNKQQW